MFRKKRGQGSLEYLIIIAAVLAIAAVVVMYLSGVFGGIPASVAQCRQAASNCAIMGVGDTPTDCSGICAEACIGNDGKDIVSGGSESVACVKGIDTACGNCMVGKPDMIGSGITPACNNDADCDDSDPGTTDTCENPGTASAACVNTPVTP